MATRAGTAIAMLGAEDLTKPLGLDAKASGASGPARALPWRRMVIGVCGAILAALALAPFLLNGRMGGEPYAEATIETVRPEASAPPPPAPAAPSSGALIRDSSTAEQLETESGVAVVRGGGASAPGSVVIRVPDPPSAIRFSPAPDPRLVEQGRHGPLPKIAADGSTPAMVYARPGAPARGRPRLAIVIGGMGLNAAATTQAVARLPDAVTLAFAPYARDLDRQVTQARADGHEALLQVPMEPLDYPLSDPGPHTLLTGAKTAETLDRLHWLLARTSGYVGVVNFMGAKFTADAPAMTAMLGELGKRGLIFLDDGSSARSLTPTLAKSAPGVALKADLVVDAVETGDAIDRALERLEARARETGQAVGSASALPVSVERIARWARGLDARGIDLVPLTALTPRARTP